MQSSVRVACRTCGGTGRIPNPVQYPEFAQNPYACPYCGHTVDSSLQGSSMCDCTDTKPCPDCAPKNRTAETVGWLIVLLALAVALLHRFWDRLFP